MERSKHLASIKVLYDVEEIIERINSIIRTLKNNSLNYVSIPNIGITYNNKLVEIIHVYKRNGLDVSNSSLILVISRYLQEILEEALKCIDSYVKVIEKRTDNYDFNQQAMSIVDEAEKFLKVYRELDQKIFYFSIEKDIVLAVQSDIEFFKKVGNDGGYDLYQNDSGVIDNYNSELSTLGFTNTIPQIDVSSEVHSEITEDNLQSSTSDIKKIAFQKMEEVKFHYKSTPIIASALESQIIDYLDEVSNFYKKGDKENYEALCSKIINFNASDEIRESVGKYVAYWSGANSFHNNNEFAKVKEELEQLGLSNSILEIEHDIQSNKYQEYIKYRNRIIEEQVQLTAQQIDNVMQNSGMQPGM